AVRGAGRERETGGGVGGDALVRQHGEDDERQDRVRDADQGEADEAGGLGSHWTRWISSSWFAWPVAERVGNQLMSWTSSGICGMPATPSHRQAAIASGTSAGGLATAADGSA